MIKLVILEMTSFLGGGGVHYYGSIRCSSEVTKEIELDRTLKTTTEVARLNKIDGPRNKETDFRWKIGMVTRRFDAEDDVRAAAKEIWKQHFQGYPALVEGMYARASPMQPLDYQDKAIYDKLFYYWTRYDDETGKMKEKVDQSYWDWICEVKPKKATRRKGNT